MSTKFKSFEIWNPKTKQYENAIAFGAPSSGGGNVSGIPTIALNISENVPFDEYVNEDYSEEDGIMILTLTLEDDYEKVVTSYCNIHSLAVGDSVILIYCTEYGEPTFRCYMHVTEASINKLILKSFSNDIKEPILTREEVYYMIEEVGGGGNYLNKLYDKASEGEVF